MINVLRLVALVALGLLSSCDLNNRFPTHGHLYFAAGSYVGQFDLSDGSSSPVSHLGDVTIDHLTTFEGGDLLLTMRVYVNQREASQIIRFKPRQEESLSLFPGRMAEFLSDPRVVIYDNGLKLFATHRRMGYSDEIVIENHGYGLVPAVVVISASEILFDRIIDGDVVIHRYDGNENESHALHRLSATCDLEGAVWLADSKQLFCRKLGASPPGSEHQLVSLNGAVDRHLNLPADKNLRALVHMPDQQMVVLSERSNRWGGGQPTNLVWIYELDTDESYVISKNQYLGDSVVYTP